jgi:hypothetical protein
VPPAPPIPRKRAGLFATLLVRRRWPLAWLLVAALCLGCDEDSSAADGPATPTRSAYSGRADVAEQMRTAAAAPRSAADGGGRAWIADGPESVTAGAAGAWRFIFEVGPEGIAEGGRIVFMVSPFWGWSPPQDRVAGAPGYATAETDAAGVALSTETSGSPMMGIALAGRALRPGERVTITYGGATGARVDRFAESRSRFWIGVDGDGDGTHRFLADSPFVEIEAGRPARLVVLAPSTVQPGAEFAVRVSFLDGSGNAGTAFTGELSLESDPAGLEVPAAIAIAATDGGTVAVPLRAPGAGVFRLGVSAGPDFAGTSNPIVVTAPGAPRIFWGDLHGHSGLSDGTGTAADYFRFARDVAALDVVSLTDHDHWGVLHLDEHPAMWDEIQQQTAAFHQPGRFVTVPGYEWTSWEYGHRHVLYFAGEPALYSSIDLRFNEPGELWAALRGRDAITVAHHSAGGPIATDWSIAPDPVLEPITEVVSVHGVSEAADSPSVIYNPVPGNFVRDVLDRGYRFGFVGSGDSHDGHPGLAHLASGTGGLAAIIASELSRPAILAAIRERRVYATSGPRIYLRAALATFPMGSIVARADLAGGDGPPALYVHAIGTGTIRWLDVVRSGAVTRREVDADDVEAVIPFEDPRAGDYVYVRVVQDDGGLAWSSPIYVE